MSIYHSMSAELRKMAVDGSSTQPVERPIDDPEEEELPPHPAWTGAKGALGFGAGMGAGYLGARGVDKLMRAKGHPGLHPAARVGIPVVSGLAGLGYAHAQGVTLDKMREDAAKRRRMKEAQRGSVGP